MIKYSQNISTSSNGANQADKSRKLRPQPHSRRPVERGTPEFRGLVRQSGQRRALASRAQAQHDVVAANRRTPQPDRFTHHSPHVVTIHRAGKLLLAYHVTDAANLARHRDRQQLNMPCGRATPLAEQRGKRGCSREPMAFGGGDWAIRPTAG